MTQAERLAEFAVNASYDDLFDAARQQLKIRVLDALGCAIGAIESEVMSKLREQTDEFGGQKLCTLIGGGKTAPDRAAFYNSALVRYLDFNDSYLARRETCHPSDNVGSILAAAEYANATGRDFLTALAVAYQVQCRLSDVAPVRAKGFDHTTQGAFALGAGISRALVLDASKTANAIAVCGTAFNALRVTRTGALSNWKGLAYPNLAFGCTHSVFLAMRGITGPLKVFEGNKGFMDSIAGHFEIDWSKEDLEKVTQTIVKKYNAEIHSQSALEGILELWNEHDFAIEDIVEINIEVFDVAYNIIGGGEEGDKTRVRTKEEADHSLPYLIAVALIDGQVMPAQFRDERIVKADVQSLLRKVHVSQSDNFSRRFPEEMPSRIIIKLRDGTFLTKVKRDYAGFRSRPATWDDAIRKFDSLAAPYTTVKQREDIVKTVADLETLPLSELTWQLADVGLR